MTSVVDICNLALSNRLGSSRITALTDSSKNAREVNLAYPQARDFVQRAHPWNCTIERASLAAMTSTPEHTYANQYQHPSDAIRILDVDTTYDWVSEGRKILTDEAAPLKIRYQKRVEDPQQFDPMMIDAIVVRLAYMICESITQSPAKQDRLDADFKRIMKEAKTLDAQEGSAQQFREDDWVNARY